MFDIFKKSEEDLKQEKTNKIERFFGVNLGIKKELHDLVPKDEDLYSEEDIVKYMDKLYDGLRDFRVDFKMICKCLDIDKDTMKMIDEFIVKIMNEEVNVKYDSLSIRRFFNNRISNMRSEFVSGIKRHFVGHTGFNTIESYNGDVTTINELLHLFHSYVMNNEDILQSMNVLDTKDIGGYPLTLYGKEDRESRRIFDSFPGDTGSGYTDLISLPGVNKSFMMVRDKGHALTIEITYEDNDAIVEYFVPKLCNIDMVNLLPGVIKVKEGTPMHDGTTGRFITDKESLPYKLSEFIRMVPEDKDMIDVRYDGPVMSV